MPKLLVSAPVNWRRVLPLVYIYRGDAVLHVCSSQLAVKNTPNNSPTTERPKERPQINRQNDEAPPKRRGMHHQNNEGSIIKPTKETPLERRRKHKERPL
ncbi:6038_t:CDS:2 [Scutellospora calospora]|uniref:6038_t:CDS:1 n=1 Tax=Scutellospora calospora TaxID=85575 RepID=A0ACA9K1Z5_9GLOM|nr:6038_t:CDS:2 [Scutellospora calospora]